MGFWSRRPAVGLDIGSRLIKAVQLSKKGKSLELEKFGVAEIYPSGERPTSEQEQRLAIVDSIRRAMADAKITTDRVVTAVAGESIIVRYIQLPEMPESELANALRWEAEEYIPFPVDEVNIDSAVIGTQGEGDARRMNVLLVCARKDLIRSHVDLLEEAGLSPAVVDVDSFAFLNCFDLNYDTAPDEPVGLVNVGGDITTISVCMGGMPRFSRDISIGGCTVSAAIQQRLGIPLAEAETLKIKRGVPKADDSGLEGPSGGLEDTIRSTVEAMTAGPGDAPGGDTQELQADRAIRNTLANLMGEIRRSIQFFENQSAGALVKRVVLGGGAANFEGLVDYLKEELNVGVEIIDPLLRIPVSGNAIDPEALRENRNLLGVGVGLALRKAVD